MLRSLPACRHACAPTRWLSAARRAGAPGWAPRLGAVAAPPPPSLARPLASPNAQAASPGEQNPQEPHPEFDFSLAVALAGASFEAYATVTSRGLPQRCSGGVEVVYTDPEFLKTKMAGLLRVSLESLALDSGGGGGGGVDGGATCALAIGDSSLELDVPNPSDKKEAPPPRSAGYLYVRDLERTRLTVRVSGGGGKDGGGGDLGAFVPGHELTPPCQEVERALELRDAAELLPAGTVRLRLSFFPFSSVPELCGAQSSRSAADDELGAAAAAFPRLLGAPGPALMSDSWRRLGSAVLQASATAFDPVAFIECDATDTQAWAFVSRPRRQLVLAFRGTEQGSWKDLLTDISMSPIPFNPGVMGDAPRRAPLGALSAEPGPPQRLSAAVARARREVALQKKSGVQGGAESQEGGQKDENEGDGGLVGFAVGAVRSTAAAAAATAADVTEVMSRVKAAVGEGASTPPQGDNAVWVHSGFLTAYDSVRGAVLGLVDTALAGEGDPETEPWTVLLTGHSLGGALATLAAFDLSRRAWGHRPKIAMYNFGSPRVGSRAFAAAFDAAVPDAWRLATRNDAVVAVPRLVGYCHVGHAVIVGTSAEEAPLEVRHRSAQHPYEGTAVGAALPAVGAAVASAVAEAVPAMVRGAVLEVAAAGEGEGGAGGGLAAEQLAALWEQEREAWGALMAGTAISEHMEEEYFARLEEAVEHWRREARAGGGGDCGGDGA